MGSTLLAVGLHRPHVAAKSYNTPLTFNGSHRVTAFSEFRQRQFAVVYSLDKSISSFTGRPPALSRLYCNIQLPLDISDEDILADRETLDYAVQKLDNGGWNTAGNLYSTTCLRVLLLIARLREEVLEIALSPHGELPLE
jgi:hypothetical protein